MTMPQAVLNSSKKIVPGKLCSKQTTKLFLDALNTHKLQDSSLTLVSGNFMVRDPPIMLIILPISLCCTAQKFTYCA